MEKMYVSCHKCGIRHNLEMEHVSTESENRSIGIEYEHTYCSKEICDCGEKMITETLVYEYPLGFLTYYEFSEENCTILNGGDDLFIVNNDIPTIKHKTIDFTDNLEIREIIEESYYDIIKMLNYTIDEEQESKLLLKAKKTSIRIKNLL